MQLGNWFQIAGGLALFLFGIRLMGDGIELMAGARLKNILKTLTKNRFLGLMVGIVITAIIQSSNATTAMTVGFVNVGLLDLSNSIGIIMGANIGTTITGQLIAINIDAIAPLIAFAGIITFLFVKNTGIKSFAQTITGLGVLFLGMATMKENMTYLQGEEWFRELIINVGGSPLLGILVGTIFTLIVQSVSASVGILQAMAGAGIITLGQSIFIICGQNIGCTIAAITAAVGGTKDAKRAACVHVLFNIFASVLCVVACYALPCVEWIESLTPTNPVQQLANANTFLKVGATIVLFPCATLLEKLSMIIIPDKSRKDKQNEHEHIRIADIGFGKSSVMISQIESEVDHMFSLVKTNVTLVKNALTNRTKNDIDTILDNETQIDMLNRDITMMLVNANKSTLSINDALLIDQMHHIIVDFERIGDHAENIAGHISHIRNEKELDFSVYAKEQLGRLFEAVERIVTDSYACLKGSNVLTYKEIEAQEQYIDDLVALITDEHIKRLDQQLCNASIGVIYIEIVSDLERIGDHCLNIAQASFNSKVKSQSRYSANVQLQ